MHTFESSNDKIHKGKSADVKNTMIVGETKKVWIKLPKELGGKKANVKETIKSVPCKCGKHTTDVYLLDSIYSTMYCDTVGQWAWIKASGESFAQQLREMATKKPTV
jgi:hypothetical protein